MDQLKSAVRKLIASGIVVLPDALDELKRSNDPITIVDNILSSGNVDKITRDHIINSISQETNNQVKVSSRPQKESGTIPRRIYSRLKQTKQNNQQIRDDSQKIEPSNSSSNTIITTSLDELTGLHNFEPDFTVTKEPEFSSNLTGDIDDLVGYFQDRFVKLSKMFKGRYDIKNLIKIKNLRSRETDVSVIGMLTEKQFPPNGGARLILEDPSSDRMIEVIVPKSNPVLVEKCLVLMDDTVVCVMGYFKNNKIIANEVLLPDIPKHRNTRSADVPVHVAYLSDIHIGSKNFLNEPLDKFIQFLNGEYGSRKLQALGKQTKYVLFGGDVVDGVGIYPNQIEDLKIDSINDQYDKFAYFVEQIPEDVQIVVIPGNHDMVRSAEPQPKIEPKYAPALNSFENVHMLPNPAQVGLHGVEVLMYHCTSLPDILNHVPGFSIDKPVEVMKHMLKARHLAPVWGARTPIASEPEDHLVINRVPDIFHGGHIHINGEGHYNGVQIVNSGTMQKQTSYQKSLNIVPTPGQVTLTNLQTKKMSRIDFIHSD